MFQVPAASSITLFKNISGLSGGPMVEPTAFHQVVQWWNDYPNYYDK